MEWGESLFTRPRSQCLRSNFRLPQLTRHDEPTVESDRWEELNAPDLQSAQNLGVLTRRIAAVFQTIVSVILGSSDTISGSQCKQPATMGKISGPPKIDPVHYKEMKET
jgi:hypothetical protein